MISHSRQHKVSSFELDVRDETSSRIQLGVGLIYHGCTLLGKARSGSDYSTDGVHFASGQGEAVCSSKGPLEGHHRGVSTSLTLEVLRSKNRAER